MAGQTPSILTAWEALDAYIDDMVADRRHTLTDDLISELIRAEDDGDRLGTDELRMLVAGLLMAGTDTTRNQLAAAVHVLCDHPEQGTARTAARAGRQCRRGDHAAFPGGVRDAAHRHR